MWRVTPEFVIELKSASDRVETLRTKMREWTSNGVALAWLILPETRSVEIYRADGSVAVLAEPAEVAGTGPVQGFVLRLARFGREIKA
jgi:Uma2 family endonuclease